MKAIMYGAGNIGRGFIGALFSQSGYDVSFVDVAKPVVEALQTRGSYPLRVLDGTGYEDIQIEHVGAIDGTDADAVDARNCGRGRDGDRGRREHSQVHCAEHCRLG